MIKWIRTSRLSIKNSLVVPVSPTSVRRTPSVANSLSRDVSMMVSSLRAPCCDVLCVTSEAVKTDRTRSVALYLVERFGFRV